MDQVETLILGAGAAGMMCAAHAGGNCVIIDHAKAPGEKIRISGGGRCNFTNLGCGPGNFISANPHFCKSALSRYTQWDFLDLIARYRIAWHEKTLGQLFCDGKATQIVDMLRSEMARADADLWLGTSLREVRHDGSRFQITLEQAGTQRQISARNLVLATGGKSIPKMGASGLAYDIARQFDLGVTDTRPGLVPLTFPDGRFAGASGTALPVRAGTQRAQFEEAMLLTHRGLSGPAILQVSSYWREGEDIVIDLDPEAQILDRLRSQRQKAGRKQITTELGHHLPPKLVLILAGDLGLSGNLADQSDARLGEICTALRTWRLTPAGTEGYRTAEVTVGGINTDFLSSKTMEAKSVPGLYAIGEAVDVTGWLGGYNFQWAWSSGWAAGQAISAKRTA